MSKIIQYPKAGNSLRQISVSGAIVIITVLLSACTCINNVTSFGNVTASEIGKKIKENKMSDKIFERNFTFFNILPYSPGREKQLAGDAIEYMEQTGNDIVLYCMTLHPEGQPALTKANRMLKSYRVLKQELAGTNVRLGVLIQSIIGHWPRVDKNEEKWTRSVNISGKKVRYCPLDENFRKYIFDVVAMFAKEKPVFILGDDDIRSFSPEVECFCPLHTAEFNRRTGNNFTPAQYRKAVKNSKVGDEIFTAFEKIRQEIPAGVAALIRSAIDSVDPSIPAGSSMPAWEYRFNNAVSKAIAGKSQPPVMRICNANYQEKSAKDYPFVVVRTMAFRKAHPDIPFTLDEADTFPHNLYSRSSRSMHAKLCSSIFSGLRGAKIWLVNTHKNGRPVHKNYTRILGKYQNFYKVLAGEVQKTEAAGVIIPGHKNFIRWHAADPDSVFEGFIPLATYASRTFGFLGIPFQCDFELDKNQIYAVAGAEAVARFSDSELKKLLSGKLLLDGPAAAAFCERGFSAALGLKAEMVDFRFNREMNPVTKQSYPISKSAGVPKFTLLSDKAEVRTILGYAAFSGAELETVAPATVIYKNALGGTVCCTAYHHDVPNAQCNEPRKIWFVEILDRLNGSKFPIVCQDFQDITTLTRNYNDGSTLMMVCNLNFDELDELKVRCSKIPSKVLRLTPEGTWNETEFRVENDNIFIKCHFICYSVEVFKFL